MPTRVPAAVDPERTVLTAEDFLEWLEPGRCADLIDGEIRMHSPVSIRHARLLNFLDRLLGVYVDRRRLGELFPPPITESLARIEGCKGER